MITVNNLTNEYIGLSTDEPPIEGVRNGSTCFLIDTGETFIFDEENHNWVYTSGSGGGGSGTKELYFNENGTYTEDITNYAEVEILVDTPSPSGTLTVNENGSYDITNWSDLIVNVPPYEGEMVEITMKNETGIEFSVAYMDNSGAPTQAISDYSRPVKCYIPKWKNYYTGILPICKITTPQHLIELGNVVSSSSYIRIAYSKDLTDIILYPYNFIQAAFTVTLTMNS